MSYAVLQDMLDRGLGPELIDLTDIVNVPPTTINATRVQDALDDATADINSFITATNTPTPLNPVPRVIKSRCIEIARYRLWQDRASEKVTLDFTQAMAWLKLLAQGQINLGDNIAPTEMAQQDMPQVMQSAGDNAASTNRTFTKDTMGGF